MSTALIKSQNDGAVTGFRHSLLLLTADDPADRQVVKTIGMVRGNSVRTRHVGRDILAGLKTLVGGELTGYTKLLAEAREQAIDRMVEQAVGLGANAVTGLRFSTSMVMGGAAEMLAYGTAVVLE